MCPPKVELACGVRDTPLEHDHAPPAERVRLVSLKSPLKLGEVLTILIKLGLELSQLRKLRSVIILRRGVHLSIVPRCPGIFPRCGGSTTDGGVLCVIHGSHGPIDVEALPCRVVAVGFAVGIQFSGIEASARLLRQPLSERGDGVPPRS